MAHAAITARFIPATATIGPRIKATAHGVGSRSITVSYDHHLSGDGNYASAARALIVREEWFGSWVMGLINDDRAVFACLDRNTDRSEAITIHGEG